MAQPLSSEDFRAMAELSKARRTALQNMFNGTKLTLGTAEKMKARGKVLKSAKDVSKHTKKLIKDSSSSSQSTSSSMLQSAAQDFIKICAGVENIEEVIEAITSQAVSELVKEITPIVGIAFSGFKTGKAAKAVYNDGMALYQSKYYKTGFRVGDPLAAAEAVQIIIKRDLAQDSINLARNSTSTGSKIALLVDPSFTGSTAVSAVNALAGLGLELVSLGIEIKEMQDGNKRLLNPSTLGLSVFNECPILGCYLLTCADTSTVANMFIADIGLPNWMEKVEIIKRKKMEPLLKLATKQIQKSRLQLTGLGSDKGIHTEKGFFAKKKSAAMKYLGMS